MLSGVSSGERFVAEIGLIEEGRPTKVTSRLHEREDDASRTEVTADQNSVGPTVEVSVLSSNSWHYRSLLAAIRASVVVLSAWQQQWERCDSRPRESTHAMPR